MKIITVFGLVVVAVTAHSVLCGCCHISHVTITDCGKLKQGDLQFQEVHQNFVKVSHAEMRRKVRHDLPCFFLRILCKECITMES
jgi:hypothetical protein